MSDFGNFSPTDFGDLSNLDDAAKKLNLDQNPSASGMVSGITDELSSLEQQGYLVNAENGKVKTPEGEYNTSDFASGAAMAGAGIIPEGEAGTVDKKIKDIMKNSYAKSPFKAVKGSYGSVGGASAPSRYTASSSPSFDYNSLFGGKAKKRDAKVISTAGMVKNMNGSPIGVGADNIFDMISRRYKAHRKANKFIEK